MSLASGVLSASLQVHLQPHARTPAALLSQYTRSATPTHPQPYASTPAVPHPHTRNPMPVRPQCHKIQ
eukprot:1178961-Prorocentrum_minimum.AAC.2